MRHVETFLDFVTHRSLWLVHVGHSWSVYRLCDLHATEFNIDAVRKDFPKAAQFKPAYRITHDDALRRWATMAEVTRDFVAQRLNREPSPTGVDFVFGLRTTIGA